MAMRSADLRKNILVLGAGFGGLRATLTLERELRRARLQDRYRIILIDRNTYHTFTPLLYEVATTSKQVADYLNLKSLVTYPLAEIFRDRSVTALLDEVLHLDIEDGAVHLKVHDKLPYAYLILAIGSETNYFDIPGLKEHGHGFKTFDEAIAIRDMVYFEVLKGNPVVRVVVGGGGSTGVELAGEIEEWICELREEERHACDAAVTIVEAGPSVLPGFDPRVVAKVQARLKSVGVTTLTGNRIVKVERGAAYLESGVRIPFDVMVWTGGVQAASLAGTLPVEREPQGRVKIAGVLQCIPQSTDLKAHGRIYAIGDIACIVDPETGRFVPQVARAAIKQGEIAARNIVASIKQELKLTATLQVDTYTPKEYPYIVPVGGKYAVAKIGGMLFSGFIAWIIKGLVELNYLVSIMPPSRALKIWFKGLKTFIQNDRLG